MSPNSLTTMMRSRGLSPRTADVYAQALGRAGSFLEASCGTDLARADSDALDTYVATLPRSHSTLVQLRSALRHYWAATGRDAPPLWAIRPPAKPPMRCRALEDDDAARLAEEARTRRDRKGAAVLLGLYAALRRAEIAGLRWDDIDPDGWARIVGKGDRTRYVPFHPIILEALAVLPRHAAAVFPGDRGRATISPTTVWEWVRDVSRAAGLPPIPSHRMRHTALAIANDETGDLRAVQELAGHARPETTAGYTRVHRKRLAAIVAAIHYGKAS